jgi:hypothetical protein
MPANPLSLLDNVRSCNGMDGLRNFYSNLLKKDREKALELINDQYMKFGTLYQLRYECSSPQVDKALNPLYRKALQIIPELSGRAVRHSEAVMRSDGDSTCPALRWMLKTGFDEDELGDVYDQIMEHTAALLTRSFHDADLLPEIAEMIFIKNRSGKLIHELVWAFFEARKPESLTLITQRLISTDSRDVGLAKRLLCFIPCIRENSNVPMSIVHAKAMTWLQKNLPFLYYTGESLHLSGHPLLYAVEWNAKYLCRPVSAGDGELLSILNPFENELIKHFEELPENSRRILADFSYMLYRSNFRQWTHWIQLPLASQENLAVRYMGGLA